MSGRGAALERVLQALREHGSRIEERAGSWMAQCPCPAHDDSRASLSITQGKKHPVALQCLAKCETADVLTALGLTFADISAPRGEQPAGEWTPYGPAIAIYDYVDEDGRLLYQVCRTANKDFPQRRPDPAARSGWRWKLGGVQTVPYRLPQVIQAVAEGKTVWCAEGEKDVHALEAAGVVATTAPGGAKKKWPREFDQYFAGATVNVVADRDEPGRKHAVDVATCLRSAGATAQILEALEGKDAADHLAAGHGLDTFSVIQSEPAEREPAASGSGQAGSEGRGPGAATVLVQLAADRYELGVSQDDEPYAIPKNGPRIARLLRGGKASLRAELAAAYYAVTGRPAPQQALAEALLVIEGIATQHEPAALHLRVAEHAGRRYLDLGDVSGRAVEISSTGWRVIDSAPVTFRRTALTGALPEPVKGGSFDALWALVNVGADYRPLLKAWLVSLLWPNVPHTIVVITGEQGTGKSTATRFFAAVIDTSPAQTRKPPKDADAWVTAAAASWVVALDNLTSIPEWLSNALCRASTGEGDVRRTYYTTADVTVIAFRRVVILNGIDLGDMADDLTDRAIPIGLDVIPETERTYEEDLPERWHAAHPEILGAVLNLAVEVMRRLPGIRLVERPRMADYARILHAVDLIDGTTGLDTYRDLIGQLAADTAENITTLINISNAVTTEWEGTAKELLEAIRPADPAWKPPRDYPKDGRAMSAELRKRAPTLRRLGWTVQDLGANNHAKVVRWRLAPPPEGNDQRGGGNDTRDTRDTRTTQSEQPELCETAAGITAGIAGADPRNPRGGPRGAGVAGMPDRGPRAYPRGQNDASSQANDRAAGTAGIAGTNPGLPLGATDQANESFWAGVADSEEWSA